MNGSFVVRIVVLAALLAAMMMLTGCGPSLSFHARSGFGMHQPCPSTYTVHHVTTHKNHSRGHVGFRSWKKVGPGYTHRSTWTSLRYGRGGRRSIRSSPHCY